MSQSFDRFWNDPLAYPIAQLVSAPPSCNGPVSATPQPARDASGEWIDPPDSTSVGSSALARDLSSSRLRLSWVDVTVIADLPTGSESAPRTAEASGIAGDIAKLVGSAREELILVTPYFVPGERGVALMRELRERGVRVRVLTNSLAATDAPVVHTGYARYRPELLSSGVELHELRNQLGTPRSRLGSFGSSLASLHAKAVIVDRRTVLVGSMNMDPRSMHLNSEMGIVIPDARIASQLVRLFEDIAVHSSYRVEQTDDGRLRWIGGSPEATIVGQEPDAGAALRLLLWLLTPFAPEELL